MSRQTVEFSVTAAERLNETLNAFLQIDREGALRRADEIEQNRNHGHSPAFPSPLKTTSALKACRHHAGRRFSATIIRLTTPPLSTVSLKRAQSLSGKPTATSLRWARQMKTPPSARFEIPGTQRVFRVVPQAVRQRLLLPASSRSLSVQTPAAPSVNRH